MRTSAAAVLAACWLLGGAQVGQPAAQPPGNPDHAAASTQIIASTNVFRAKQKLSNIEADPQLAEAARYFAEFMARTSKYSHSADGQTPAARTSKFGYDHCIVAENIAYQHSPAGFTTRDLATRFFEGWQNSPDHRKNMLNRDVTDTAVAIARSPDGRYYAVQLFGRPKSESTSFSIANRAGAAVEYSIDGQTFPLPPRVTRTHQLCTLSTLGYRGQTLKPADGQRLVIVNDQGVAKIQLQ